MQLLLAIHLSLWTLTSAFVYQYYGNPFRSLSTLKYHVPPVLFSSSTSAFDLPSDVNEEDQVETRSIKADAFSARNRLLLEAQGLVEKSITGVFITIPSDRLTLQKLVTELEALAPSSFTQRDLQTSIGDWELLCTSRGPIFSSSNEETKTLPFSLSLPKPPDSVRKSISILQKIVAENDNDTISRIDHIIEYTPLSLQQLIPENSPLQILRDLNVNPLQVSRTKLTLVHNAQVESLNPVFRTKISLKNVAVTVAGTSQFLNPQGAEILGLNVPSLGEFLNAGSFDTTYVDDKVRISRGTIGILNEIRVFVRKGWSVDSIVSKE